MPSSPTVGRAEELDAIRDATVVLTGATTRELTSRTLRDQLPAWTASRREPAS